MASSLSPPSSQAIALYLLDSILHDFNLPLTPHGSTISFTNSIPSPSAYSSQKINLPLIGTIRAFAKAVVATQRSTRNGAGRRRI